MTQYQETQHFILFNSEEEAIKFTQSPQFTTDNHLQKGISLVVAKSPKIDQWLVTFSTYHTADEVQDAVTEISSHANQYGGTYDDGTQDTSQTTTSS